MGKLGKSINETNLQNFWIKKITSSLTLSYYPWNTHFLYRYYISFMFSLKYFENKYLSCLPLCIFLLPEIFIDVSIACAWVETM